MFEPENVPGSIDVTVVNRAAVAAFPFSHSEVFQSSRTADASAIGTDLGSQPLTSLLILHPVPSGFIAELASKERPAGVEDGFCHPCPDELGGIDVADNDVAIGVHQARRFDMEVMSSGGADFAVNGSGAALAPGALRAGQMSSAFSQVPHVGDLSAVRACDESFETEIEANRSTAPRLGIVDLYLKTEEPAPAGVTRKTPGVNLSFDRATVPEPISSPKVDYRIAADLYRPRGRERHPAERLLPTPSRAPPMEVTAVYELLANSLDCIAVQAQEGAASGRQLDQIESGWPPFIVSARSLLDFAAVVPHTIGGPRKSSQSLAAGGVFDPISIGQKHDRILPQPKKKGASPPRPERTGFPTRNSR